MCGLQNGAIESKQASPSLRSCMGLHSQCLQWADPEGPSSIFLLHKSGHLEGKLGG